MSLEIFLIIVVGFLAGMIPAMLIVGFWGGRQSEKRRKELKLKYEQQLVALRGTIRRLMQRIEKLTGERNQLKTANKGLRDAVQEQRQTVDAINVELEKQQNDLKKLRNEVDDLASENLRYEGRLQEAQINQERMASQFKQTVADFTEVKRLRKHLLFATNQLRQAQLGSNINPENRNQADASHLHSPAKLDVSVIQTIEPLFVERLHESGIHTIADLAEQTPERVAHFVGLSEPDDSKKWIAQAKAMINRPSQSAA